MKFILNPSLQQMALIKTAIELWNEKNITKLIKNIDFSKELYNLNDEWQEVEEQVVENVHQIPLPKQLKKDLRGTIRPIGHQIQYWCSFHHTNCRVISLPDNFIWRPEGIIDRKRTSQTLINDENIDVVTRYKSACVYCLEDEIPGLWNQIPEPLKLSIRDTSTQMLVEYWSHRVVGQMPKLDEAVRRITGHSNPHACACDYAFRSGNATAYEFFFSKLSDEERDAQKRCLPSIRCKFYSEVYLFLLSQMSHNEQVQWLAKCFYSMLWCFLSWPYQPLFMVVAEHTVPFIDENTCYSSLQLIARRVKHGFASFENRKLLHDFWVLIPLAYKQLYIQHYGLTYELFEWGEEGPSGNGMHNYA